MLDRIGILPTRDVDCEPLRYELQVYARVGVEVWLLVCAGSDSVDFGRDFELLQV